MAKSHNKCDYFLLHKKVMSLVEDVQRKCLADLQAVHVECLDLSEGDGGAKLEITVVSDQFEGVPLLKRHRLVNEAIAEFMPQIHAVTIKAWTPVQYETKK